MPKVTFITPDGETCTIENARRTLMAAAVKNQVPGIQGDCGGVGSCGTCHVHIDPEWTSAVGPASEAEIGTLELEDEFAENSRLGCQVKITDDLDGLVVRVANR